MGNTNQKSPGKINNNNNKKNSDNHVMVKKVEQKLQFKDNPVVTMFFEYITKVEQQVQLFKTNHVLPVFSKFGSLLTRQTVDPPPLKLQAEKKETNSLAVWQVSAVGGYFILKWAWAKWNEQRAKKKSSDDPL